MIWKLTISHDASVEAFKYSSVNAGISALILAALIVLTYIFRRKLFRVSVLWKMEMKTNQNIEAFMRNYATIFPKRYNYLDIKKMTNLFTEKLGHGGFGCVYKGKLSDDRTVAVKVLSGFKGNGEDFVNEIGAISRTSHVNVVSLFGFCYQRSKRALVYEFIAIGSLDSYRTKDLQRPVVIWSGKHYNKLRLKLLEDLYTCTKITDFGLAKLYSKTESKISIDGARGTIGYIAPKVALRMMVLEMVSGRKNLDVNVSRTSEMHFLQLIYKCVESQENSRHVGIENEFELQCQDNITMITTISLKYRVLALNLEAEKLTVATDDYWNSIYPTSFVGTTLNNSLFH
ncbi:Serine-threonine/tyrosine-protein kinase, catalytic domain [Dillenia turbinata]|uniref:non-specific serine/threonine protein kinase n=1 Tax=Dillenia turbinata TaxID=194707 RepID=A0AAN8Z662_9MAGN